MKHWVFRKLYTAGVVTMYHPRVHWSFKQVKQQLSQLVNFFAYFIGCNIFNLNTPQRNLFLLYTHLGDHAGSQTKTSFSSASPIHLTAYPVAIFISNQVDIISLIILQEVVDFSLQISLYAWLLSNDHAWAQPRTDSEHSL